jgi:hypothetical protein
VKYNPAIVRAYWLMNNLPGAQAEYAFHPLRKWRFDFAWTEKRVALEVQGGIFVAGRHSRGAALLKEWEKLNAAARMGWRILYCQPQDICTLDLVATIWQALIWRPR